MAIVFDRVSSAAAVQATRRAAAPSRAALRGEGGGGGGRGGGGGGGLVVGLGDGWLGGRRRTWSEIVSRPAPLFVLRAARRWLAAA